MFSLVTPTHRQPQNSVLPSASASFSARASKTQPQIQQQEQRQPRSDALSPNTISYTMNLAPARVSTTTRGSAVEFSSSSMASPRPPTFAHATPCKELVAHRRNVLDRREMQQASHQQRDASLQAKGTYTPTATMFPVFPSPADPDEMKSCQTNHRKNPSSSSAAAMMMHHRSHFHTSGLRGLGNVHSEPPDAFSAVDFSRRHQTLAGPLKEIVLFERLKRLESVTKYDLFDGSLSVIAEFCAGFETLLEMEATYASSSSPRLDAADGFSDGGGGGSGCVDAPRQPFGNNTNTDNNHGETTVSHKLLSLLFRVSKAAMMLPNHMLQPSDIVASSKKGNILECTTSVMHLPSLPRASGSTRERTLSVHSSNSNADDFSTAYDISDDEGQQRDVNCEAECSKPRITDASINDCESWYDHLRGMDSDFTRTNATVTSYKQSLLEALDTLQALDAQVQQKRAELAAASDLIRKYQTAYQTITKGGTTTNASSSRQRQKGGAATTLLNNNSTAVSPLSSGAVSPQQHSLVEERDIRVERPVILGTATQTNSTESTHLSGRGGSVSAPLRLALSVAVSGGIAVVPPTLLDVDLLASSQRHQPLSEAISPSSLKPVILGATEEVVRELLEQNGDLITKVAQQSSQISVLRDHVVYLEKQVVDLNAAVGVLVNSNFELSQQYKASLSTLGSGSVAASGGAAVPGGDGRANNAASMENLASSVTGDSSVVATRSPTHLASAIVAGTPFYSPMLLDGRSAEVVAMQSTTEIARILGIPFETLMNPSSAARGADASGYFNPTAAGPAPNAASSARLSLPRTSLQTATSSSSQPFFAVRRRSTAHQLTSFEQQPSPSAASLPLPRQSM